MDPREAWKQQAESFGKYLRTQRELAELSLRELAALTDVSNAYLSQLERGLHQPSVRVLHSLATALGVSTEQLLAKIGLVDEAEASGEAARSGGVEEAVRADERLSEEQKKALLSVYRSYVESN
jgi:transcriptional regulator with XRE-family HTH domain